MRKNLTLVLICILFGSVSTTVTTGSALTGYVKSLGASDFAYSLLVGAPYVAKFMQLVTSYILEKTRARRTILILFGLVGRLMWIPVALVPYFVPVGAGMLQIWVILTLVTLLSCICAFNETAFSSLMADLVPSRISGGYFGARQGITMASGVLSGFLISWILDAFTADGSLAGYTIVFIMAGIFGALDIACYFFVEFPPMKEAGLDRKRVRMTVMLRDVLSDRRCGRIILLLTAWTFSTSLSGPFYHVHMLGPMHMTYSQINVLSAVMTNVATLLFSTRRGKTIDRYGNKAVLQVSAFLVALIPLLWLFTGPGRIWVVPLVEFCSGIIWAPVGLAVQNTYLYQAPEKNRSMYFAVYFCFTQMVGITLSYAVGGWLVDHLFLPLSQSLALTFLGIPMNQYPYIFVFSCLVRVLVVLTALRLLPERENDVTPSFMLRDALHRIIRKSSAA